MPNDWSGGGKNGRSRENERSYERERDHLPNVSLQCFTGKTSNGCTRNVFTGLVTKSTLQEGLYPNLVWDTDWFNKPQGVSSSK